MYQFELNHATKATVPLVSTTASETSTSAAHTAQTAAMSFGDSRTTMRGIAKEFVFFPITMCQE